jgi:hypothetical protein
VLAVALPILKDHIGQPFSGPSVQILKVAGRTVILTKGIETDGNTEMADLTKMKTLTEMAKTAFSIH